LRRRLSLTLENNPRTRCGSRAGSGSATRLREPDGQSALHDPRNRRELRLRPDEGGVLPALRQQAANRQLSGSCPNAFSERGHGSRSAHQSRRQQPSPQNARPTRLALTSVPTREQPHDMVPEPCWPASGSNPAHRDRRLGAQALDRNLALRYAGPRTGRGDHRRIEFRRRSISGG
jgi:hypothetical protein